MGVIQLERKTSARPGFGGLEHKSMLHQGPLAPVETKMIDEEEGIVEAFVAVTGIVDRVNDIIEPGAIGPQLKTMWPVGAENHDWGKRVAKTLAAEEYMPGDPRLPKTLRDGKSWPSEAGAFWVRTQYNLEKESGRDAFSDVKFYADQQDWSIGYRATKSARGKDGIRRIKSMEIPEYSTVLTGANKQARTLSIKSDEGAAQMTDAPRVIATFDDHVIVSTKGYDDAEVVIPGSYEAKIDQAEDGVESLLGSLDITGERKAYAISYEMDEKGQLLFSEPTPVDVVEPGQQADGSKDGLAATLEFVGYCQDEIKAGRKISGANMAKLKAALGSISDVVTLAEGVADDDENKADPMAKKPHDYAEGGDGGKCKTCGTANGNPMHHVNKKDARSMASADVTPHAYVDDGTGKCSVCGDPADAAQHDGQLKADPGVGGGGPDATTHAFVKDENGYCAVCGGTAKCAIHDAPYSQSYSGAIDGVGHTQGVGGNVSGTKDDGLNDFELMMMERERLAL